MGFTGARLSRPNPDGVKFMDVSGTLPKLQPRDDYGEACFPNCTDVPTVCLTSIDLNTRKDEHGQLLGDLGATPGCYDWPDPNHKYKYCALKCQFRFQCGTEGGDVCVLSAGGFCAWLTPKKREKEDKRLKYVINRNPGRDVFA